LDWGFVWKQMGPSVGTVLAPEGGAAQPRAFPYHVTVSLRHGAGLAFALLVLPAVAYGFVGAEPLFFLGALFSLLWFFVIGVSPVHHVRYLTPILPVLCLLVARLLVRAARPRGRARARGRDGRDRGGALRRERRARSHPGGDRHARARGALARRPRARRRRGRRARHDDLLGNRLRRSRDAAGRPPPGSPRR